MVQPLRFRDPARSMHKNAAVGEEDQAFSLERISEQIGISLDRSFEAGKGILQLVEGQGKAVRKAELHRIAPA